MRVRRAEARDRDAWLRMRHDLWPGESDGHAAEIDEFLSGQSQFIDEALICETEDGSAIGIIELRLRNYAEGSDNAVVPYVEGWYVEPAYRKRGAGALLMAHAQSWAQRLGHRELASDVEIGNDGSIGAHRALGFEHTDTIVCFLKKL